eukprot:CAMPEP_0182617342 /NCGR_PEP_ID=MMETSP1330-20130603/41617_1 /TAXON_ID=464278 /ORGANISM="Picochlorum sp., Strain RCC944" /LENGTH=80 /DNA_ID=CAMNT_0024837461 /DNA_START=476 /DNA_END=718 /DNA_ORIENTATION=-
MRHVAPASDETRPVPQTRPGLVDNHLAPVCHFLDESKQAGLVITQAGMLVLLPDGINLDGLPREGGQDETLPEMPRALQL